MPKGGNSKGGAGGAGLTYVAKKPSFLQNFGKTPTDPSSSRSGREALPERPDDGQWANGSDDEDEWEGQFGGGDDGPQVVVLKQGKHLSKEELERERRKALGKPSKSPPPPPPKQAASSPTATAPPKEKTHPRPAQPSAKRKLVGETVNSDTKEGKGTVKKKKKADKGLLSFNEAEGDL